MLVVRKSIYKRWQKNDFLDLQLDNHLNWKNRYVQMIPKLSAACYAFQSMVHISNINTLKLIYYTHFHSILKYRIIVGSKSCIGRRKENC